MTDCTNLGQYCNKQLNTSFTNLKNYMKLQLIPNDSGHLKGTTLIGTSCKDVGPLWYTVKTSRCTKSEIHLTKQHHLNEKDLKLAFYSLSIVIQFWNRHIWIENALKSFISEWETPRHNSQGCYLARKCTPLVGRGHKSRTLISTTS